MVREEMFLHGVDYSSLPNPPSEGGLDEAT